MNAFFEILNKIKIIIKNFFFQFIDFFFDFLQIKLCSDFYTTLPLTLTEVPYVL